MSEISAKLVKDLREATGAGMMDCKKALTEVNGDFEAAIDWLRKKGHAAASKKSGRTTADGLVGLLVDGNKAVALELNSETDFVAKNEKFQALFSNILASAINFSNLEEVKASKLESTGKTIEQEIVDNIAVIGENLNLRRVNYLSVSNGFIASYIHNSITKDAGKIAILVGVEGAENTPESMQLARQIAMHIAAAKPSALKASDVPSKDIEHEKEIFSAQAKATGKPDNIIEKMVEGRIKKYYEEIVLLEQPFVIDGKTKVSEVIASFNKQHGANFQVSGYIRYELGEGIEVEKQDFASEVASIAGK